MPNLVAYVLLCPGGLYCLSVAGRSGDTGLLLIDNETYTAVVTSRCIACLRRMGRRSLSSAFTYTCLSCTPPPPPHSMVPFPADLASCGRSDERAVVRVYKLSALRGNVAPCRRRLAVISLLTADQPHRYS